MAAEDIVFLSGHGRHRTKFPATNANEHLAVHAQLRVVVDFQITVAPTRTPASSEWIANHLHIFRDTLFRHCLNRLLNEWHTERRPLCFRTGGKTNYYTTPGDAAQSL
jgi:hypothetical protein